ncbi:MAG: ATP-dependent DNA ligase [Candidatus Thermoplasmatota archaeon]|nr:ATP-dependent DNA ligase [Candidatus Thermoplasmatota archaeon]
MRFADLVEVYERLEATTKRLEMIGALTDLLRRVPSNVIRRVVYLTQGDLAPGFRNVKMGLAEKMVIRALAFATGLPRADVETRWKELGDMGTVAERALEARTQRKLTSAPLTVEKVHDNLLGIAQAAGTGSQEEKIRLLADLLNDATPVEARYILRVVVGKMRLGVADMTIVDALARAFATKEDKPAVERAYNVSSDLGGVAEILAESGLSGFRDIHLRVGVPVRSMLAERLPSLEQVVEKLGRSALEFKYDGLRIQAHIDPDEIVLYSRRFDVLTSQFPDVVEGLRDAFRAESAILDGEAVPIDMNTGAFLPFQEVAHRRRKYGVQEAIQRIPVALMAFDCLALNGEDLLERPYTDRRAALERALRETERVRLAEQIVTDDLEEARRFFEKVIEQGGEGLMAKGLASPYEAGSRGWQWIKYKRDYKAELADTVDLVIVGSFAGRGRRAGTYGALLMAAYDPEDDAFKTVCKLGSGFDDATLFALPKRLQDLHQDQMDPRVDSQLEADDWFEPAVVLEVLGAEITLSPMHTAGFGAIRPDAGLAVRFPRFTGRWRDDKGPREATSVAEIISLYRSQLKQVS